MRVTVVGSGDAFNSRGRLHSCYLIEGDGLGCTMVDFGATALAGLQRLGKSTASLDTLCITHLHGDHIGGIPFLVIDALFARPRGRPLDIVGPVGLEARIRALVEVSYGDVWSSRADQLELRFTELPPGSSRDLGGLKLETFAADHMDPPEQPLCLRLSADGDSVAFSGDTQPCPGLFEAARGTGLLVCELSSLAPPAGRHCTWAQMRERLPELETASVLFTHLGPDVRDAVSRLEREAPANGPPIRFAEDGLVLEVLPGARARA